jgi:hypothetical protein
MPHLEIKRFTRNLEQRILKARDEVISTVGENAELNVCSEWSFTGVPKAQRIMPTFDEEEGLIPMVVWLVEAGKRFFLYVPSEIDQQVMFILSKGKFSGEKSDCLDLAKIVNELPAKAAKKLLEKAADFELL